VVTGAVPRVPGSGGTYNVIGWVDSHHVAVQQVESVNSMRSAVNLLDVRDGSKRRILSLRGFTAPRIATNLLGTPPREASPPPHPVDPRFLAGTVAVTVTLTAIGVVLWRRRVQP
jgi:hypothetical protein